MGPISFKILPTVVIVIGSLFFRHYLHFICDDVAHGKWGIYFRGKKNDPKWSSAFHWPPQHRRWVSESTWRKTKIQSRFHVSLSQQEGVAISVPRNKLELKKKFRRSSHRSLFFFQILFIIFFLLSMLRCRFVIVDFRCVSFLETYFLCEWENERNHLPDSPIFKGKCINSRHYLVSTPFQDRSGFLTPLFF